MGIVEPCKEQENLQVSVIRSSRKTISLSVNEDGSIVVKAPKYVRDAQIARMIERHKLWIARRRRESEQFRLDLSDGAALMLFGKRYVLAAGRHAVLKEDTIYLPKKDRAAALIALLKNLARITMTDLTHNIAIQYGFSFGRIRITSARGRWGSCSQAGTISYSFRTAFLTQTEALYVAVHELCHTRHMDHGALFWREVAKILPGYLEIRKGIRAKGVIMRWL